MFHLRLLLITQILQETIFITSLEIIIVVKPDPNIFLWIAASAAVAAVVNPSDIKTLLASGLSTFPIKGNPVYNNGPKSLPKNPPACTILRSCVFDHFTLVE